MLAAGSALLDSKPDVARCLVNTARNDLDKTFTAHSRILSFCAPHRRD